MFEKTFVLPILMLSAVGGCGEVASIGGLSSLLLETQQSLTATRLSFEPINPGVAYRDVVLVTGGTSPFKFSVTGGALFEGLELDANSGIVSGTVAKSDAGKKQDVEFTVEDAVGAKISKSYELIVNDYSFDFGPEEIATVVPGLDYSFEFAAPGAVPPVTVTASSNLPANMSINSAGKLVAGVGGVPVSEASTERVITITLTDANERSAKRSYKLTVGPAVGGGDGGSSGGALSVATTSVTNPTAGSSYAAAITATGGTPPYTFSVGANTLPTGLSIDSSTGVISGTPSKSTKGSSYSFNVSVTDSAIPAATATSSALAMTVQTYTTTLYPFDTDTGIPAVQPLTNYSFALSAIGAEEPVTYLLTSGTLPTNLTLSSSGVLQVSNFASTGGVPASEASTQQTVSVRAIDANGVMTTRSYVINVGAAPSGSSNGEALSMATTSLPSPVAGSSYYARIYATGGTTPYKFGIAAGSLALPSWLHLDTDTGVITSVNSESGAPDVVPYTQSGQLLVGLRFKVTDGAASTANGDPIVVSIAPYTLSVGPIAQDLPSPTADQPYSLQLMTLGGVGPYVYNIDTGALPSGLSLSSTGLISGTPSAVTAGTATDFVVTVADTAIANVLYRVTAKKTYRITVPNYIVSVTTASADMPTASEGVSYSKTLAATGGSGSYIYSYTGTLPNGLAMTNAGLITGTPASGTGNQSSIISVRATDALGRVSAAKQLTIVVLPSSPSISLATLPNLTVGAPVNYSIPVTGGYDNSLRDFSEVGNNLAAFGLSLSRVSDGDGTYTGKITGAATQAGTLTFTIKVTDRVDADTTVEATDTKTIYASPVLYIDTFAIPDLTANFINGEAYNVLIEAVGGTPPYTFSASNLPTGLSISTDESGTTAHITGTVSSTTTNGTARTVTVLASDSRDLLTLRNYEVQISNRLTVNAVPTQSVNLGSTITAIQLATSGGYGSKTFAVTSGSIPPGLSMTPAGLITGTAGGASPSYLQAGVHTFYVAATDSLGQISTSSSVSIIYNALDPISIADVTIPAVSMGAAITPITLSAAGGTGTYSYAVSSGSLPSSLTLSPSGVLSGAVPMSLANVGVYPFSVVATDSYGQPSAAKSLAVVVSSPPALTFNCGTLPMGTANTWYSASKHASGGGGSYVYSFSGVPSVPQGIALSNLDGAAVFSGTLGSLTAALGSNPYTFDVTVTDALGSSATATCSLTVESLPKLKEFVLPAARMGSKYFYRVETEGGKWATRTFAAVPVDNAPEFGASFGLTFNTSTGVISGTVASDGSVAADVYQYDITVTDENGLSNVSKRIKLPVVGDVTSVSSFTGARFSEVCAPGGNIDQECGHYKSFNIGFLNPKYPTQKYLVTTAGWNNSGAYSANWNIEIRPIDSTGRVPVAAAVKINVVTPIGYMDLADMDNDGKLDIVVGDRYVEAGTKVRIFWNQSTESTELPAFGTVLNTDYHAYTPASSGIKYIYTLKVAELGTDGSKDVIVTGFDGTNRRTAIMRSQCGATDCSASRSTLFVTPASSDNFSHGNYWSNNGNGLEVGDVYGTGCPAIVESQMYWSGWNNISAPSRVVLYKNTSPTCDNASSKTFSQDTTTPSFVYSGQNQPGMITEGAGASPARTAPAGVAIANFAGGSRPDLVVTYTNHNKIHLFINQETADGTAIFDFRNPVVLDLPNPNGIWVNSHRAIPFCYVAGCTTKSLLVALGTAPFISYWNGIWGGHWNKFEGISVFPNQNGAGINSTRVDYPIATSLHSNPILTNLVSPTGKLDLAMVGLGARRYTASGGGWGLWSSSWNGGSPFFAVLESNFPVATEAEAAAIYLKPFKQRPMLNSHKVTDYKSEDVGTLAVVDVDGNGKNEIVAHLPETSEVSVQNRSAANTGDFVGPSVAIPSTTHTWAMSAGNSYQWFHQQGSMTTADFNNDGATDIATIGFDSLSLSVLLSSGDVGSNTFDSSLNYSTGASTKPVAVTAGDVNGDGRADLVYLGQNTTAAKTYLLALLGKGDGSFSAVPYTIWADGVCATANEERSVALHDFEGDGKPEVAVLCETDAAVWVFKGTGSQPWEKSTTALTTSGGYKAASFKFAHMNYDKTLCPAYCVDIVMGGFDRASPVRMYSNVGLTLTGSTLVVSGSTYNPMANLYGTVSDVATGDFNMDGRMDVAVSMWSQYNDWNSGNIPPNSTWNVSGSTASPWGANYGRGNGQIFYMLKGGLSNGTTVYTAEGWGLQGIFATGLASGFLNDDVCPDLVMGHRKAKSFYWSTSSEYWTQSPDSSYILNRMPYQMISQFNNISRSSSISCSEN